MHRGNGIGRLLYQHFFDAVKSRGCSVVHAVTHPINDASVAFHVRLGFEPRPSVVSDAKGGTRNENGDIAGSSGEDYGNGVLTSIVHFGWDGPQHGDRVILDKRL